jgi:HK97 gp10 family phage protein
VRNFITLDVQGLNECDAKLKSLSTRVAKFKINEGLRNAAAYLVVKIERATYVGKDNPRVRLKNSFSAGAVHADGMNQVINVGPNKAKTAVAMAQEFGFPTTPAHPMMRPTMDAEKEKLIDIFVATLNEELENIKL